MAFHNIIAKLGNMRKEAEFTIYSFGEPNPKQVTIQSDKRIATVDMETGNARLSDGKSSHPGFVCLMVPGYGNSVVKVSDDVMERLRAEVAKMKVGNKIYITLPTAQEMAAS